eukprot:TRINITY_DN1735_c0_g1_i1.p1 TRINITY_DN1735_c0_g1~~TRINITY_DN1735_c0_g1_i1.p1  ORF type:complete len:624 (+),score=107.20 TRINITY_DN1735_c0_g1_i1:130-1872(+)
MAHEDFNNVKGPPSSMWRYASPAPKLEAYVSGWDRQPSTTPSSTTGKPGVFSAFTSSHDEKKTFKLIARPSSGPENDVSREEPRWTPQIAGDSASGSTIAGPSTLIETAAKALASAQQNKPVVSDAAKNASRQVLVPWPRVDNGEQKPIPAAPVSEVKPVGHPGQPGQPVQPLAKLPLVVIRSNTAGSQPRPELHNFANAHKTGKYVQCTLFIDELDMPDRPDVEPSPTDREVWVDPLPDEDELADWLKAFGDVEEVYRLPDQETGKPTEKGYVQFKKHDGAKKCVDSGAGRWSESERALSSQTSYRRYTIRCYPENMVSSFLGKKGEDIGNLRRACGVRKLVLKGADLATGRKPEEGPDGPEPTRLHFWAEGFEETIDCVSSVLEARLSEIHQKLKETFVELGEKWKEEQREMLSKRKHHRRRARGGENRSKRSRKVKPEGVGEEGGETQLPEAETRGSLSGEMPGNQACGGVGPAGAWNPGEEPRFDGGFWTPPPQAAIGQIPPHGLPPHAPPHGPPPGWPAWGPAPGTWMQPPPPPGPPPSGVAPLLAPPTGPPGVGSARPTSAPHLHDDDDDDDDV